MRILAWRYTNLVCGYNMSMRHMHPANTSACACGIGEARTKTVTLIKSFLYFFLKKISSLITFVALGAL